MYEYVVCTIYVVDGMHMWHVAIVCHVHRCGVCGMDVGLCICKCSLKVHNLLCSCSGGGIFFENVCNSTAGRVFALHADNPGLISGVPYGSLSLPGIISEDRARSDPRVPLG